MRLTRLRRVLIAAMVSGLWVLGGCTNGGSSHDTRSPATLTVRIALFVGPATLGGGMALSNSPAPGENVTAVDAVGGRHVARTDAGGVASMALAPGRYTVFSTYCGTGPHRALLMAGHVTRVQIDCPIP